MEKKYLNRVFKLTSADLIVSLSKETILWFTETSLENAVLIIEKKVEDNEITFVGNLFVKPNEFRYAQKWSKNVIINEWNDIEVEHFLAVYNGKNVAVEREYITVAQLQWLKSILLNSSFSYFDAQSLRIVKSFEEVIKIREAVEITSESFALLKDNFIKDNISEIELEDKLNYILRRFGAEKESFDISILSGTNSAKPTAHSSKKQISQGDIVTIEFGSKFKGYCSNFARSIIVGEESNAKNTRYSEMIKILEEGFKLAIKELKPGTYANDAVKIFKEFAISKGYDINELNIMGRGVGVERSELPILGYHVDKHEELNIKLEPGMIFFFAPAIYLKGVGGAKRGDIILITESGHVNLTTKEIENFEEEDETTNTDSTEKNKIKSILQTVELNITK